MSLLKKIFSKKDAPVKSYDDFWNWFTENEKAFFQVVKTRSDINEGFFEKLSPKLKELKEGFFYLTGMMDDDTVELVFTAEGAIKNIVFVEELVQSAPQLPGWKFTALKPALDITNVSIEMGGQKFNEDNIRFYFTEHADSPDEIDITIVHTGLTDEDQDLRKQGTYIFLDNYLGEMNFAITIDSLKIIGNECSEQDLIPIQKLKDYLIWRQKEFVEKYDGVKHDTESDQYTLLEGELENGMLIVATINTDLLTWDRKASHPWIFRVEVLYDGEKSNGLPDDSTYKLLDEMEDSMVAQLKDSEGNLFIGRQTAENIRDIYFACNDFRKPSKILSEISEQYSGKMEMNYGVYKDKYWKSFDRFLPDLYD
jgi:hypothetical protein